MTEHIQNKTTLLNSFLILIIPHPSPLQSLQSVVFLCVCVCYVSLILSPMWPHRVSTVDPPSVTPSETCVCTHTRTHIHTQAPWQLGVSAGAAIIPVESSREGYHVSFLFFFWLSVSCDISLVFIEGLAASSSFFLSPTLLWLERLCTRVSHILAHVSCVNPVGISAVTQRYGLYSEVVLICRHAGSLRGQMKVHVHWALCTASDDVIHISHTLFIQADPYVYSMSEN